MIKHTLVRPRGLIALVVLSLSSAIAAPNIAHAGAGCHGARCNGKDPVAMRCSRDAYTAASAVVEDMALVELRYSPSCDAWWARTTPNRPDYLGATVAYMGNGRTSRRERLHRPVWSRMSGVYLPACGGIDFKYAANIVCIQ